jgi:hypothetical protein
LDSVAHLRRLSPASQELIRRHLGCGRHAPLDLAIADAGLDQVDLVLLLDRHAPRFDDDIQRLIGHEITRLPPACEVDPGEVENWHISAVSEAAALRFKPGTLVRQLLCHGHSYEELDVLQQQGHIRLAPPTIRVDQTFEEMADWWDDFLRRHPDPAAIENWRVAEVLPPPSAAARIAASLIRVGQTVQQLATRGISYTLIDNAQREGWLRLAAPHSSAPQPG